MNCTYDEILERMNNKFYELSGYEADRVSDIGIRIRLLAGELFSLTSNIDWLKKQMFPNTASGEQLELHAQQRGLTRRKGNKSTGQIIFMLDTPLEYEVTVPKGTICTTSDGALNFVTTADASIMRGGNFVMAEAEAENSGTQYNVAPKAITTIVTYFSVGISIHNASAFSGGTDDETDEELRKRIMHSMQNISNGVNGEYYISLAKSVEGIQSATVLADNVYTLVVTLGGRGCIPDDDAHKTARSLLNENKAIGISVSVLKAQAVDVSVSVSVTVKSGYTFDSVKAEVENNITEYFKNLSVGESVTLNALGDVIFHTDGVEKYEFSDMTDTSITKKQLAILSDITVTQSGVIG